MVDDNKKTSAYEAKTKKKGFYGAFESLARKFKLLSFILLMVPILVAFIFTITLAITPATFLILTAAKFLTDFSIAYQAIGYAFAITIGYFSYGISIIFLIPLFYFLNPLKPKPFRGPWYSIESMSWYIYNALLYIPRYSFLDFITPTPLLNLFYKMMGMKIGKNTIINTTNISDACFITLGDRVVIGGSVTIFAHYGQKGYLIVEPVVIEDDVNIGLKASIMGDVHIGKGAFVSAHAVVYPKSRIKAGEQFKN